MVQCIWLDKCVVVGSTCSCHTNIDVHTCVTIHRLAWPLLLALQLSALRSMGGISSSHHHRAKRVSFGRATPRRCHNHKAVLQQWPGGGTAHYPRMTFWSRTVTRRHSVPVIVVGQKVNVYSETFTYWHFYNHIGIPHKDGNESAFLKTDEYHETPTTPRSCSKTVWEHRQYLLKVLKVPEVLFAMLLTGGLVECDLSALESFPVYNQ